MMAPTNAYRTAQTNKPKGGEELLCTPPRQAQRQQPKHQRRLVAIDVNKDEGNLRDEMNMMDLVGMGGDTYGN